MVGGEVAGGHVAAHLPEADESDRLHRYCAPSIMVMSSSESSRLAASIKGSTCSGERKPTIAPSTAGLRSVQAMATAPGTVSWRSATAAKRSTISRLRESSGSRKRGSCLRQSSSGMLAIRSRAMAHGQHSRAHRGVDDRADPLALGERQNLTLDVALDQRVLRLQGLHRRDLLDPPQLLDVEVRDADVAHEPLLLELGEG